MSNPEKLGNEPDEYNLEEEDITREADERPDEYQTEELHDDYDDSPDDNDISKRSAVRLFVNLIINPLRGWKKIKNIAIPAEQTASQLYYPLLAIAAVSCFCQMIWKSDCTISEELQRALVVFMTFFVSYFVILFMGRTLLPRCAREKITEVYGRNYLLNCLSTLVIVVILLEVLPVIGALLVFLPIYTVYLAIRGVRFLRLPDNESTPVKWVMPVMILGVPYVLFRLFTLMLP